MGLKEVFIVTDGNRRKMKNNGQVYVIMESGELVPEIVIRALAEADRLDGLDRITLPIVDDSKPENQIFSDLRRTLGAKGYKLKFVKSEPDPITGEA